MARGGGGWRREASGRLSCKAEVRLQLDNKTLYGKARNFYLDERQGKEREGEKEGGREKEREEEELARLDSFVAYSYFSREIHFQGSVYAADG